MIVVADGSPLVVLARIGHARVLPTLFGRIYVPPEVAVELTGAKRPESARAFIAAPPDWLVIRPATNMEAVAGLHPGALLTSFRCLPLNGCPFCPGRQQHARTGLQQQTALQEQALPAPGPLCSDAQAGRQPLAEAPAGSLPCVYAADSPVQAGRGPRICVFRACPIGVRSI